MKVLQWNQLDPAGRASALARPQSSQSDELRQGVAAIIQRVREGGDEALAALTEELDRAPAKTLKIDPSELVAAEEALDESLRTALLDAVSRIRAFHSACMRRDASVATAVGVVCERIARPIQTVGLYVPAGSAPLPSTTLMLGVPAGLAGCANVVLCSPPNDQGDIDPTVLAAASLVGVKQAYCVGGAQAVAAMAYGTDTVPKCDKIFGPGNAWVTEAKTQVSLDPAGAAIDMPAGPSEVMVVVEDAGNAEFAAADLLAQAEHGPDSQAILVAFSEQHARRVVDQVERQLQDLPRKDIARQAISNSRASVVSDREQALEVVNTYAAEHLILQLKDARDFLGGVTAAGSVFLGDWTPESVGDYCSGTNHVLPTYGYARAHSGVSVDSFQTQMTVQELTPRGLATLADTTTRLAEVEGLEAHARAVSLRMSYLKRNGRV